MTSELIVQSTPKGGTGRGLIKRLRRDRRARVSVAVLVLIAGTALLAPLIAHFPPTELHVREKFLGPSTTYWFGTDELGRDLFSRVLYGGRTALAIAVGSAVIATSIGLVWGALAAMSGRWPDEFLMRAADASMAVPIVLAALILVAAFGPSIPSLVLIIGLLGAPWSARVLRASIQSEMQQEYFLSGIATGARRRTILMSEIIPNVAPTLLVQFAINLASAVLLEAALSFFGVGVQPPLSSWGTLLLEGYRSIFLSATYAVMPGLMIFVTIWALNSLSDAIQSALEPKGHE